MTYRKKTIPREVQDKETTEMDNNVQGSKEQEKDKTQQDEKEIRTAEADPNDEWVKKYKEQFGTSPTFF